MSYEGFVSGKYASAQNNNINNTRISIKTNNYLNKTINGKVNITSNFHSYNYNKSDVYRLLCSCNKFYTDRPNKIFNIKYKEHISEIR